MTLWSLYKSGLDLNIGNRKKTTKLSWLKQGETFCFLLEEFGSCLLKLGAVPHGVSDLGLI